MHRILLLTFKSKNQNDGRSLETFLINFCLVHWKMASTSTGQVASMSAPQHDVKGKLGTTGPEPQCVIGMSLHVHVPEKRVVPDAHQPPCKTFANICSMEVARFSSQQVLGQAGGGVPENQVVRGTPLHCVSSDRQWRPSNKSRRKGCARVPLACETTQ